MGWRIQEEEADDVATNPAFANPTVSSAATFKNKLQKCVYRRLQSIAVLFCQLERNLFHCVTSSCKLQISCTPGKGVAAKIQMEIAKIICTGMYKVSTAFRI